MHPLLGKCDARILSLMPKMKLPAAVLARFREFGRQGGKLGGSLGGKTAAANMTPAARSARARKASAVAAKARRMKKRKA